MTMTADQVTQAKAQIAAAKIAALQTVITDLGNAACTVVTLKADLQAALEVLDGTDQAYQQVTNILNVVASGVTNLTTQLPALQAMAALATSGS
jgi:prophage DNA circulation protein